MLGSNTNSNGHGLNIGKSHMSPHLFSNPQTKHNAQDIIVAITTTNIWISREYAHPMYTKFQKEK